MDIKTYREAHGISQAEFGKRLTPPVSQGRVWQWENGDPVDAERCIEIESATSGAVKCEDLRPDIRWEVVRSAKAA